MGTGDGLVVQSRPFEKAELEGRPGGFVNELLQMFSMDFDAYLQGPALLCALGGIGLLIGVLTGLFGVGGAFLINPMLIVLMGMEETLVVGSSLSFTIGTAAAGAARHRRMNNVDVKAAFYLLLSAVVGVLLGVQLHYYLRDAMGPVTFKATFRVLYLVMLLLTAWVVARGPGRHSSGKSPLQRMRLRPGIKLSDELADVSLPGLLLVGCTIGMVSGLLGIGGGVLFVPLLLIVVGLTVHRAIGTSLAVIMFSAIVGTVIYGSRGDVNLSVVMVLLVGSGIGVQIGAWICQRLHARKLQQYFVIVILFASLLVALDLARKIIAA